MTAPAQRKCVLELSDGTKYEGDHLGAPLTSSGELIFTTGMVGYTESCTDPSYFGQILTFSYPLIGNYGVPSTSSDFPEGTVGFESRKIHASGVVVSKASLHTSHWNSGECLDS